MQETNKNNKFKKRLIIRTAIIGFFLVLFLIFVALTNIPSAAEFLALNVSQPLIRLMGGLTEKISFSLFEMLVVAAILLAIYLLIALIVNITLRNGKRVVTILTRLAAAMIIGLVIFNATMGFAYYRGTPQFGLPEYNVERESAEGAMREMIYELYALADEFSDENGVITSPYSFSELYDKIAYEYSNLGSWFYSYTPAAKPLKFSYVMSYIGFSGVFFAPTAEANINVMYKDTYYLPHVIAHELAHAKGVNREADAETAARYVLLSSSDRYLRYCGLMNSYGLIINALTFSPDIEEIFNDKPVAMINEWQRINRLQDSFVSPLQTLFDKINSWYINKNNQTGGSDQYLPDYGEQVETQPKPPDGGTTPPQGGDNETPPEPDDQPPIEYEIEYSSTQKMMILIHLNLRG